MIKKIRYFILLPLLLATATLAEETFTFKGGAEKWGGERIPLPTGFAPDMQVKGIEEIRFAPGMFKPEADDFFTYVFVFSVEEETPWTPEVVHRELLLYYKGLSKAVSKGKVSAESAEKFTCELKAAKADSLPVEMKAAKNYIGELKWIEPFRTMKAQTLHLDVTTWNRPESKRHYLFAAVSPQKRDHALWKTLREIRAGLEVAD